MDAPNIETKGRQARQAYEIKRLWENLVNTQLEGSRCHAKWSDHWAFSKDHSVLFFAPTQHIDEGIALCIHEAGHIDSDFSLIDRAQKQGKALLVFCNNVIEDVLVENLQCKRMDGANRLLVEETDKHIIKNRILMEAQPEWRKRGVAVYTIARKCITIGNYPEVEDIARRANLLTESGEESYALAVELYELIRAKEDEEKKPEDKPEEKPEKGEADQQPEEADGDDSSEDGSDGSGEENEPDADGDDESDADGSDSTGSDESDEPEGESGEGDSDGDDDEEADANPQQGSGASGDDDAVQDAEPIDGTGTDNDDVNPFQRDAEDSDEAEPEADGEDSAEGKTEEEILADLDKEANGYGDPSTGIWEGIAAEANAGVDKVTLEFVDSRTQPVTWIRPEQVFKRSAWNPDVMSDAVKTAYMRLQRVLQDADEVQRKKGLKKGKLNGKSLHRLQVDNDRIFTKKLRGIGVRQFAFSIVFDMSGSMGGNKISEARKSAYVIAETLDRLHIPFSLTGFNHTHRIMNYNYKDFSDNWSNRRESLAHCTACGSNMDCHSITEVYRNLIAQAATHRVMIVISDGQPAPENPSILRETVPLWEREVKVIGIGLSYGAIRRFYSNAIATTAAALPIELAKVLQQVVFEQR